MNLIIKYIKPYVKESVCAPLFKMLEAVLELFVPLVVAAVIDNGIGKGDTGYIVKMVAVMAVLAVVGFAFSVTAQYFAAKAAVASAGDMRESLFRHIQKFSYSQLDEIGTETLITRMTSDVNQVQNAVNLTLRLFLRSPFIVFGAMIMAFTVNFKAGLVFVLTIAVLSAVVFGVMTATRPMYKRSQSYLDKILGITRENLTGARVIRAFDREEGEVARFKENNAELTRIQKLAGKISGLSNPMTFAVINFAVILLIYVCSRQADKGIILQGQAVALYNYMAQILIELVKLASLIVSAAKGLACANRIADVFAMPVCGDDGEFECGVAGTPEVEFRSVSFSYQGGGDEALTDISFTVQKGQTVGIVGSTGSGKTTLLNLAAGFYQADAGRVLIEGREISEYKQKALRKKIAVTPQKAQLFKGTIRENLAMAKEEIPQAELDRALEISQSKEFVLQKEGGVQFNISQNGKNLSGGQRQRLTIARALAARSDILILDDSGSALDYATDAKLRKAIGDMEEKPTVFISAQRASSVMAADIILVLDDGRLVGSGSHESLMENCEVYREIYYSQFPKEESVNG